MFSFLTSLLVTILACTDSLEAVCQYESELPWSYNPNLNNGPEHWGKKYSNCSGNKQSPINIITANVVSDPLVRNLELENYDMPLKVYLMDNNGYSVNISSREVGKDKVDRTVVVNGEKYNLSYILMHWGDKYYRGSEHLVDNIQYAFELQLVHTNKRGNIAVVSMLYESSLFNNSAFDVIVRNLKRIPYKGYQLVTEDAVDLSKLVSNGCPLYRYTGSLTSPGCDEGVIWSICKNPLTIGYNQLNEFRKLINYFNITPGDVTDCKLVNNFRPTQPLNGRNVTSSA